MAPSLPRLLCQITPHGPLVHSCVVAHCARAARSVLRVCALCASTACWPVGCLVPVVWLVPCV
eukprot:13142725-Alexandrium_andersonii.AAC.1